MQKPSTIKLLQVELSDLERLPEWTELKTQSIAFINTSLFVYFYLDTYWATWLQLKVPNCAIVDADMTLFTV